MHLRLWAVCGSVVFSTSAFCAAAGVFLPAIDGTLSGDLFPLGDSEHGLHWIATMATPPAGDRTFSLSLESPGVKALAEGTFTRNNQVGTWRVREAGLDLERGFGAIAAKVLGAPSKLVVAGKIAVVGAGDFTNASYSGSLRFDLMDGSIGNPGDKWALHDVAGQLLFPDLPRWTTAPRQRLLFREFTLGELSLQNGMIDYTIESAARIRVHGAQVDALGGKLSIDEFAIDLEKSQAEMLVRLVGAELSALRSYLPKAVAEAHGKVDGQVVVRWSGERGLQINVGSLQLRPGENATLRLAAGAGFLSSHVPERYSILPENMGWFSRLFSQVFPAHHTLELIEQGQETLIVESVQADLNPQGEGTDTTAVVRVVARPTKVDAVKKVRLTIRISGPLADVVRFGLDGRLSFGL